MRHAKRNAIALFCVALILFLAQAGIWMKSTSQARSETDKQNMEGRHPANEFAGVVGTFALVLAGVLVSIPRKVSKKP